jgi:hypothetical protein
MRKNRSARIFGGMMLLSWLTIPFIGRQHIKRYLSSTMFISFLIMVESYIAEKKKWWIFPNPPHPYLTGEAALIYVYQHLVVEKPKPQRALKNNPIE